MSIEAMKQALEFIKATNKNSSFWLVPESNLNKTVNALRTAIEQMEKQEPVTWAGYNLDDMCEAFDRVIEEHHQRKNPFHDPVNKDAMIALRILRGFVPHMKRYTTPPAAVVNQQLTTEPAAQTRLATREEKIVRPGVYEVISQHYVDGGRLVYPVAQPAPVQESEFNCPRCGHCCSQRQCVGLTDEEKETLSYKADGNTWAAVELAEAKLREKSGGQS